MRYEAAQCALILRKRNIFQLLLKYLNDEYLMGPPLCGGGRRHVEHYICTIILHTRKVFSFFFLFVRQDFPTFLYSNIFFMLPLMSVCVFLLLEICLSCESYLWIIYFCLAMCVKQKQTNILF